MDSVAPCYTEVIPLESDYKKYDYSVRLLYPEWKEMTKAESVKMAQWSDLVSEDIHISTFVGVSRGRGVLDVDFLPVVSRNGKFFKLTSAKMQIEAVEKTGIQRKSAKAVAAKVRVADRYTKKSKLAEGKWVKIAIKEDGMYRLTRSALQKMGFKNPDNVHLYGHGGYCLSEVSKPEEEYDDLQEVPLFQVNKDTWLFWGNGLVYWHDGNRIFNPYATTACYFLTEEDAPSKMQTIDCTAEKAGTPITSFTDYVLHEKDEYGYAQLGRNLFEAADFASSGARTYKLTPNGTSLGNENLTVAFTAASTEATTVSVQVNGKQLGNMSVSALSSYQAGASAKKEYSVMDYKNGTDWTVKIASTAGHEAHLDYLSLHYTRQINPGSSFVAFTGEREGQGTLQVSGVNEWCEVMQIGEPGSPACLVKGNRDGGKFTFSTDDLSHRFVCFNINVDYPQPQVLGTIENQNLHALESLDMVIIIPESGKLQSEAERLADVHRRVDGMRVQVVRADQIYNEFSSGTPDATAYRRLMKMLYDRADGDAAKMPRYLLLMGAASFDNRMLTTGMKKFNPKDFLLCFESEESFSDTRSYVMEDYFGLLDDGEGTQLTREKPDLGIGRFPVTTADEARVMVDKVVEFAENRNAGAWKNVVMMLGDDGDNNSHMDYCDEVAELVIDKYPEIEVRKVMWDAYTRVSTLSTNTYPEVTNLIKKQLDEGVMVMNYTGHGAPYVLSHEAVWKSSDMQDFKGKYLPLWFTAACDISPFDAQTANLGVQAVLNEGGGALAFIGTTRTVYATNNKNLNRFFSTYLFGKDDSGRRLRVGDALRMSKVSLVGTESTNRENKLQYVLLGDPALLIGAPLNRVEMESLTDEQSGKTVDKLCAGMSVRLDGKLLDENGDELTDFNGVVTARLFDSMDTITCLVNDGSKNDPFQFKDRSSMIYAGRDSVRNGRFTISFVVPKDIKYSNGGGRVVFYAINDSLNIEANGYSEQFTVGGSVETTDQEGPVIELTLNGEIGGVVNSTPYLEARLSDKSGINFSGNGVGHDVLLSVDNNPKWTAVLNDYYQSDFGDFTQGSLAYVLPALPAGPHTLSLRAWDLLNNTSLAEMDFVVDASYEPSIMHLAVSPNPASTSTTFFLTHDLPGSQCDYLIEVFDFSGRRLWMHEGHGSSATGQYRIPWNLSVGGGYGRISPGVYLYRATISTGDSKKVSKSQKLIVR